MNRSEKRIVVKIGGATIFSERSELSELREYLRSLQKDPNCLALFLVGGGDTVESMRVLHRRHPELDPKRMHWRCIELLKSTTDAAEELLPFQSRITSSGNLDQVLLHPARGCYLVEPRCFYHPDLLGWIPPKLLPKESWDTTSDTLAWLLAFRAQADEIQLIKKPDCSEIHTLEQASAMGIIDPQLPMLSLNHPPDWKLEINLVYHKGGWRKRNILLTPTALEES